MIERTNAEAVYMSAKEQLDILDAQRMAGVAVHCGEKGHKAYEETRVKLMKQMDDLK